MSNLLWLTDVQMERLKPFFPKSHRRPRVDDRRILSGVIFINRNGLRRCDAPRKYGSAKILYNRWKRWSDNSVLPNRKRPSPSVQMDGQPVQLAASAGFVSGDSRIAATSAIPLRAGVMKNLTFA